MKTLHKKLTALLLSVIVLITGLLSIGIVGGKPKNTAHAEDTENYDSSIYYFSDSEPVLSDNEINDAFGDYEIYHDIRCLSSEQEFKYLLYTGYFWKFTGFEAAIIIQINTVTLNHKTWENLYICLSEQQDEQILQKNFMFITTENLNYSDDVSRLCPGNKISDFLMKPFGTEQDFVSVPDNTSLLLDSRLIGIYYDIMNYHVPSLLHHANLRKLYEYMFFGLDKSQIASHEEDFFGTLWTFYKDNYLDSFDFPFEFNEITEIKTLIDIWNSDHSANGTVSNSEFWENNREAYEMHFENTVKQYFTESEEMNNLTDRNVRIILRFTVGIPAYNDGNLFYDLFEIDSSGNAKTLYFSTYYQLFNYLNPVFDPVTGLYYEDFEPLKLNIFVMSQWFMSDAFYDFLLEMQKVISERPIDFLWNIDNLAVYLLIIDEIYGINENGLQADFEDKAELTEEERREILEKLAKILDRG